jgi:hypothetical protein
LQQYNIAQQWFNILNLIIGWYYNQCVRHTP